MKEVENAATRRSRSKKILAKKAANPAASITKNMSKIVPPPVIYLERRYKIINVLMLLNVGLPQR